MTTTKYIVKNLGCANCAAKMEAKINSIEEVKNASLTFATKQLSVTADNPDALLGQMQEICATIENDTMLVAASTGKNSDSRDHSHNHDDQAEHKNYELYKLFSGSLLFIAGMAAHLILPDDANLPLWLITVFTLSYLILGGSVLLDAAKSILKGQVFNEDFLMSIATLGAFAIGDYPEAVGVMLFFSIGELFEHRAVEKSRKAIMDAVDMRPETVNLVLENGIAEVPAETVSVGSIIQIRPGDRIPLDGIVIDGESRIDTSPVTGEPVPVKCQTGDSLISGCINTSGLLSLRVEKELKDSMVTKILDAVENAAAGKPKMDRFITKFAKVYTPIVVFMALAVAVIPSLFTGDWNHWIYTALTFLVISCPCALVLSVPLAFFSGIGVGSRKGILFKGGSSLEALTNIKSVILDKTGTITEGNFTVQNVTSLTTSSEELLSWIGTAEQSSTHPIAGSILMYCKENNISLKTVTSISEIAGKGIRAEAEGHTVLCGNNELLALEGIDTPEKDSFGTYVHLAMDGIYEGSIILSDTIKEGSKSSISKLKKQGINSIMLTGDNSETASYVGKEIGIDKIYSQLLPEDKLEKCISAREQYGAVMFVGDGINDAPVLAGADVGAAMGSGADAAIDAADIVFMTSDMEAIPKAISIAKRTLQIAKQNITFALAIKALVMILGLFGIANMWFAVFADSGVAMLCILNSIRILKKG